MGLGVIRYKIWHDLWENKGRTLRVVMIIAIGAFAVGVILGGREFISKDFTRTWQASVPATIGLEANPPVDDEVINALENLREIEHVEGWFQERIQWRRRLSDPWEPAFLMAIDDYQDQSLRKIFLDRGSWPDRKLMGVQRGYQLGPGAYVYLKIDNGREEKTHRVELNGALYNAAQPPVQVSSEPVFYTTRERFRQLTGEANYGLILATIPEYSPAANLAAADLIQRELEKQDVEVDPAIPIPGGFKGRTSDPDQFIAQDVLNGVFLILTTLAGASLILGLFLVYNTINAVISQQVSQIGVMKAVGASFGQILLIYFSVVVVYAVLALLVAVPLGALGAHGLRVGLTQRFNMLPGPFEISTTAVLFQVGVALLSPLLAATGPIFSGARVTVREAISTYGLGGQPGWLDRWLVRLQFIPRLVSLTVSNTFRNKRRVILTQISLVGAGAIFMMVLNVQATLVHTFSEVIFSIYEANVMFDLEEDERIKEIEALTLSQPGVKAVEVWGAAKATIRPMGHPETNDDHTANLRGLPLPSTIYRPQLRAGRWLEPGDRQAVVLNQELAKKAGVGVGDWIRLDIPLKRTSDWQVVGLVFDPLDQETVYTPRELLAREIHRIGQGKAIKIQTIRADAQSEAMVAANLRALYEARSYDVQTSRENTAHQLTYERVSRMSILIYLLTGMAIVIAIVGAVALSGTLSINVLERTREIGVMRAIGASGPVVAGQFIGEGLILGWLSWLIAWPLSLPAGQLVVNALSELLGTELVYQASEAGVLYWLAIISILAVIASWFPAQKAAQTRVQESLAYA